MPPRRYADIEEYYAATQPRLDRRLACEQGNLAALYDALVLAFLRDEVEREHFGEPLVITDSIRIPEWLVHNLRAQLDGVAISPASRTSRTDGDVLLARLGEFLSTARTGKVGRHARWARKYRSDMIDWSRFNFVWLSHLPDANGRDRPTYAWNDYRSGRGPCKHDPDEDVFTFVSRQFGRGVEGGAPATIRKSYERVTASLARGEFGRYYPAKNVIMRGLTRSSEMWATYESFWG